MANERPTLFPIFLSSLHHRAANTCASRRDLEAFVRNNEKVIPYGMVNRMITLVRCIPRHKIAECLEGMNDFPRNDDVSEMHTESHVSCRAGHGHKAMVDYLRVSKIAAESGALRGGL